MKRILVLSVFPAPYRIAVFAGLAKYYDLTIFFERNTDEERTAEWFVKSGGTLKFHMLDDPVEKEAYDRLLKDIRQFDLVLCYDPWTKSSLRTEAVCIRRRVKYIINADGALDISTKGLKAVIKRHFVRHASLCFAGSGRAVEYFLSYGAKQEIIIRHRFTSLHRKDILLSPVSREEKSRMRMEKGLEDKLTFIAVGQFIERKGFDLLLQAWSGDFDARLLLIGGGSKREEYQRYLDAHQIKNVRIMDFLPKERLFELYRISDVFVMPTREDIWGLVVNEAMANRLPVLSSDRCTAGLELIKNGENGFVYPVGDTDRLHELIDYFITHSQELPVYAQKAVEAVRDDTFEEIVHAHHRSICALIGE